MECFACWPFGTKGHYHLPNAMSPVLMDFLARNALKNSEKNFVLAHDSWNVQGKYVDYMAISEITGLTDEEIEKDYNKILMKSLPEILKIGKLIVDLNINASKNIKARLGLMSSGKYLNGKLSHEIEFRDDSPTSWKVAQKKFLQLYESGLIYYKGNAEKPEFYLNMKELFNRFPIEKLLEKTNLPNFMIKMFRNNYRVYQKDLPLSTIRAYATPVPFYITKGGRILSPREEDLPLETRLEKSTFSGPIIKNFPIAIKPLFNCYFTGETLEELANEEFDRITFCNDQTLLTRFNFPQLLISTYLGRGKKIQRNIIHELLVNKQDKRFSFKQNVLLSLEELTKNETSLARFIIAKNIKLGGGKLKFQEDRQSHQKLRRAINSLKERESSISDKRKIRSNFLGREVEDLQFTYQQIVEKSDIRRAINFLTDYIYQLAREDRNIIPQDVHLCLDYLNTIIVPEIS